MFSPSVELTKDGVFLHLGGTVEPYEVAGLGDLLHLWYWPLEAIDPEFTLGDLARLLGRLDNVDALSGLLNSPVGEVLEYPGGEGLAAECPMRFLEVCNVATPTRYHPDPEKPDTPCRIIAEDGSVEVEGVQVVALDGEGGGTLIGVSDPDALTGKVTVSRMIAAECHGSWGGPYHVTRTFRGWGPLNPAPAGAAPDAEREEGAYSLFFAVLPEVAHLPLRYNPELVFGSGVGGEPVTQQVTITVGEFLYAVFYELGFNGPPENRVAMRSAVCEQFGEFFRGEGPAIPWWGALE
jgi:hypothetical protein